MLLEAATLATLNMARGEGKLPKWAFLLSAAAIVQSIPLMWVVCVMVIPPTQCLFSAVHNQPPGRRDSAMWYWMQSLAYKLRSRFNWNWYGFGIAYGAIRAIPTLPAIIYLGNPWLLLLFGHGLYLYLVAKFAGGRTVRVVEGAIAAIIGMAV